MENAPAVVSRILGGPAMRPAPPIWTSFVGVKMSFVLRAFSEISVRLPTTVADGEFNAETQRTAKDAENCNHGWTRMDTDFLNRRERRRRRGFIKFSVFSFQCSDWWTGNNVW